MAVSSSIPSHPKESIKFHGGLFPFIGIFPSTNWALTNAVPQTQLAIITSRVLPCCLSITCFTTLQETERKKTCFKLNILGQRSLNLRSQCTQYLKVTVNIIIICKNHCLRFHKTISKNFFSRFEKTRFCATVPNK